MSQISQIKKIYHAAIYVRLSKEDGAVASHEKTESNSIANQKSLIRDFLENKNDIEVVQEYVDDGFSGSNFERPAFQMMLEDIKKGKIDCVVTKDLSRFGREYIDSGMYIERLFPAMGVRFIAINDGIDSGEAKSQSDEIIIPFKNLINDREQLITAEELCQYQREYESRVNEIEAQITELLHRRSLYEKEFHIDEGWEETVNKYMAKRKLTKELVDAFVSEIVFYDGNIEVKLLYDDFLKELLKVAEEREVSSNG